MHHVHWREGEREREREREREGERELHVGVLVDSEQHAGVNAGSRAC